MNNQSLLRYGLAFFGAMFVIAGIFGLFVLIFNNEESVAPAPLLKTSPYSAHSPVVGDRVVLFTGRNFTEYNLVTGNTRKVFPEDAVYPSVVIKDWSEDLNRVIIETDFHRGDDLLAAQLSTKTDKTGPFLWLVDFSSRSFSLLPAGFSEATFSTNNDELVLVESANIENLAEIDSLEVARYNILAKSVSSVVSVPGFVRSIDFVGDNLIAEALNNDEAGSRLYRVTETSAAELALVGSEPIENLEMGAAGIAIFVEDLEKRSEDFLGDNTGGVFVFDANLEPVGQFSDVSSQASLMVGGSFVGSSYTDGGENVLQVFSFVDASSRKLILADGALDSVGPGPLTDLYRLQGDKGVAKSGGWLVSLDKNDSFQFADFEPTRTDEIVSALRGVSGSTAFADNDGRIFVSFFNGYTPAGSREVDAVLSSLDLDPALVPIIYATD